MTDSPEYKPHHTVNGVTVPLGLFTKLMRCYYGDGPRDGETTASVGIERPLSPATEKVAVPEPYQAPDGYKDLVLQRIQPETLTPRGFAARKAAKPEEDEG